MDATLPVIDSAAELARARSLTDRRWASNDPADTARLEAQARLIAAFEESRWPSRPPATAEPIRHLMAQHGRTRELVRILGTPRAEHGNGAAVARPFSRAGRPSHSRAQAGAASRGLSRRGSAYDDSRRRQNRLSGFP